MTIERIRNWINAYGTEGVYVSFSGGKDSTVLLDIVRNRMGYSEIPAVFVDTGLEYPEIRDFVKTFDNVVWLKPKMNFRKVIETYGYPFVGKEISDCVHAAKHAKEGKWKTTRLLRLEGKLLVNDGSKSQFNYEKWHFLLNAPFEIGGKCCDVMKKAPAKKYEKDTGKHPILAQMAEESRKRTTGWMKTGCNAFNAKRPQSNPLAFWTEQDILHYIKDNKIPICSVYGDIVEDTDGIQGQMDLSDFGLMEDRRKYKTTGCNRTGCMFCGYGCHLEKAGEGRFEKMKITHPKQYEWIMKDWDKGGLGYKKVIDWINENGNMEIKY